MATKVQPGRRPQCARFCQFMDPGSTRPGAFFHSRIRRSVGSTGRHPGTCFGACGRRDRTVAQVVNLPYRRMAFCGTVRHCNRGNRIGRLADCQSAIRSVENIEHRTPNIEHRTSNAEHRIPKGAHVRCSAFDVRCSMFLDPRFMLKPLERMFNTAGIRFVKFS